MTDIALVHARCDQAPATKRFGSSGNSEAVIVEPVDGREPDAVGGSEALWIGAPTAAANHAKRIASLARFFPHRSVYRSPTE